MRTFEQRREAVFTCAATKRRQARSRLLHVVTLVPMLVLTLTLAAWPLTSGLWQTEAPVGKDVPPSNSLGIEDRPFGDKENEIPDDGDDPLPDENKGEMDAPGDDAPTLDEPSNPSLPIFLTVSITDETGQVSVVLEDTAAQQIAAQIQVAIASAKEVAREPDRDPLLDVTPRLTVTVCENGMERVYSLFCDTLREGERYYVLSAGDANALWTVLLTGF